MILPIVAYGDPVLKSRANEITPDYPKLADLINDMYETMYNAKGVGLAAPQIGLKIRLFITDATPFNEDGEHPEAEGFKKVFINPQILEETGQEWSFNEGCLSIPGVRENVLRKPELKIMYYDENFNQHIEYYSGIAARVIQHEYDHIEGILFTDRLNPLKRRLIKGRLNNVSKGEVDVEYRMKFPLKKGR